MLIESEFAEICCRAGITIADPSVNIGRELTYLDTPVRTIVIYFLESEFPEIWKSTMEGILRLEPEWIFVNRFGAYQAKQFLKAEVDSLLDHMIKSDPSCNGGDDQYLVSRNGKILISYDHHMFDNGLPIYTNDIQVASSILVHLNEIGGVQAELLS